MQPMKPWDLWPGKCVRFNGQVYIYAGPAPKEHHSTLRQVVRGPQRPEDGTGTAAWVVETIVPTHMIEEIRTVCPP